mgnify:CR=1 FL=1
MKNWKRWLLAILLTLVIAFVYYYINLPALNIHSAGFWCFVILMVFVFAIVLSFRSVWKSGHVSFGKKGLDIQKGTMGPYRRFRTGVFGRRTFADLSDRFCSFFTDYQCEEVSEAYAGGGTRFYSRYQRSGF